MTPVIQPLPFGPEERLYPAIPAPVQSANGIYTMGSRFTVDVAGQITHLRYYHMGGLPCVGNADHLLSLWSDVSPVRVLGPFTDTPPDGQVGWREIELPVPFLVEPGLSLRVSYSVNSQVYGYTSELPPPDEAPSLTVDPTGGYYGAGVDAWPSNATNLYHAFADIVYKSGSGAATPGTGKGLTLARSTLLNALTDAGIRAFYGMGAFSAPCARIFPAEPWVEVSGRFNGQRLQSWEVWAVAGRTDSMATFDELEAMVSAIDAAIDGLQSWSHPTWRRPAVTEMGGAKYFACRGTIETIAEVH